MDNDAQSMTMRFDLPQDVPDPCTPSLTRFCLAVAQLSKKSSRGAVPGEGAFLEEKCGSCSQLLLQHAEIANALLDAQERDRWRIATDLHDGIGQDLSVVKMSVETVCRDLARQSEMQNQHRALITVLSKLRGCVDELRRIALGLRPSMLDDIGLLSTLEWCCREFVQANPEITLKKQIEVAETDILLSLRCDIYRVIQEALHNVSKHARAGEVAITLRRDADSLLLSITDDGCGFDPREGHGMGIGLYSMQARSERSGGSMTITSAEDAGTCLEFRWPLPSEVNAGQGEGASTVTSQPFIEKRVSVEDRRRSSRGRPPVR